MLSDSVCIKVVQTLSPVLGLLQPNDLLSLDLPRISPRTKAHGFSVGAPAAKLPSHNMEYSFQQALSILLLKNFAKNDENTWSLQVP